MTTTFKPGSHPDADQLSAFIEQALPAHERDGVLAHLAACGDCRAVVALALPEEPASQPAPEPRRSPFGAWFSNWMVFLPAVAAVAVLAAFILFVHRQGPAPQQQAEVSPAPVSVAPPQLQSASPAESNAASTTPQAEIATPAPPPATVDQKKTAKAATGSADAIQPTTIQPASNESATGQNIVIQNQSVQSTPTQNAVNSFAPATNNAVVSQNQSSDQATVPRSTYRAGAVAGALQSNDNFQQTNQQAEGNVQNRQQQSGLHQTANQTVQVQPQAPPVATESAELNGVISGRAISNLSFTRQPVPSGLPLLSSAAQGPIVLAIDTHHAVFVSNDSGQHWKTVHAAWKGHAVMVDAVAPVKKNALPEPGANLESLAGLPQSALIANPDGANLTGTVTDPSGAVVPGAAVTITDPQTHLSRTITTDANGRYVASGLHPGSYDLDATARGFKRSHLSEFPVAASKENLANITLLIGAATQTVTVESSEASIEVENAPEDKAIPKPKTAPIEKLKQAREPLFEIVTDKGVHWTSADGLTWQPK